MREDIFSLRSFEEEEFERRVCFMGPETDDWETEEEESLRLRAMDIWDLHERDVQVVDV